MNKVFISSPYRGDIKKNLQRAIKYCREAYIYNKIPIAPHVYFTRVFPEEDWRARHVGMLWGKDLMQYCSEIWIFCNELTEGMIEEIAEAKKLGLNMKFFNVIEEEITYDNYLISIRDLDLVTIGLVLDIWTEKSNDGVKYRRIAEQEDFDLF